MEKLIINNVSASHERACLSDEESWDHASRSPIIWKTQLWAFLILLLTGFWSSSALADLIIPGISQKPQNNVPLNAAVTYQITVTYPEGFGAGEFAAIRILDNGKDVTQQFTSRACVFNGIFFCGTVSDRAVFDFSWTPGSSGAHTIIFDLTCSPECFGDREQITTVVADPQPPTANAGPDQTVTDTDNNGAESVTLDGSGSSDPDNDIAEYEWFEGEQMLGAGQTLEVDLAVGSHTLTLVVTDQSGNSGQDEVIVTVNAGPQAPVANAGPDQTVTDTDNNGAESVTLDGSDSSDPDNDIARYEWFEDQQSLGTGQTLAVDLAAGDHMLRLVVTDTQNNTSNDDVIITVQSDAGPTIEILSGGNQRLSVDEPSESLSVRVVGSDGEPLQDVTIFWSVTPDEAATLDSDNTTTVNGLTSNRVTPARRGPFKVTASIPGGVSTSFQINPIAGIIGLNDVQRAVAGALDNACFALQSQTGELTVEEQNLLDTCESLATASDLQQLVPEEVAAQGKNSISFAAIRTNNLLQRLDYLRGGATGPSLDDLSVSIQGELLPSILFSELTGLYKGGGASADSSGLAGRLGVFVNGSVSFGDTDTTEREAGFDFNTTGLTLGVDYRFTDQFVLGGAFNYISTDSDYNSNAGKLDIDGYSLALYGTYYQSEQMFVDGILSVGLNNYDSNRGLDIGAVIQNLHGDTDGTEVALGFGTGYEFHLRNFTFVPHGRINYTRVQVDGYDEKSPGSGLSLNIGKQDIDSLLATVGGLASLSYSTRYGVFIPHILFEWEHEFKNDSRAIIARFLNDPTKSTFSVLTDNPDRDYFNLGLGLSATFAKGKSAFLYYENTLGLKDTSQYSISGGFRLEF